MSSGRAHESLYLVDAHSLIFQVFHALPEMSSPSGLPTNALFGFTKDMLFLRTDKKPDYLVCCFDVPGRTFRDEIYAEYKAHRAPMPDDLHLQIPLIHQMLEAMRIPVVGVTGYEADDVIATLAAAGAMRDLDVLICSSDKDCRQLITDCVKIYSLRKRQVFDRDALQKDWGIRPDQVIDLQALVGDSVDNVPGVPGVGLKTAAKLLQEYDTLENILKHIDELPGAKRQENFRQVGPLLARSRQLVTLATNVPMTVDWENWRLREWDAPRLLALFREWGFHRLGDEVRKHTTGRAAVVPAAAVPAGVGADTSSLRQGNLFSPEDISTADGTADGPFPNIGLAGRDGWKGDYHLVDTADEFERFQSLLQQQPRLSFDLATTDLAPRRAGIVGYAFSWRAGESWYIPVRGPSGEVVLDGAAILARLKPMFENPAVAKINYNVKYDSQVLRQHDVCLAGTAGDPMIADYLLHAGERSHNIEVLADKHLHHQVIPITDLIGKGKKQLARDQVAAARLAEYAGEYADIAWRLCDMLEPQLAEQGWKPPASGGRELSDASVPGARHAKIYLYDDLEIPLTEVLGELEFNGMRLDVPFLRRLGEDMTGQLANLEKDIHRLAGREFNIASLKQLREVMFDDLKLPTRRKTNITGEASTDQETLEALARDGHELPQKLVTHRQIAKLKGTYVDTLPLLVSADTGRLHASFNQTVAATGRLSSSDPNLQNIPIRSEQGGQIRQAFLPEEGWSLLTADYSQIELRLLAHFSEDEELRSAFAADHDIHAKVASQIYHVPEPEVTEDMRRTAKTVNFGVIYGMSAFGLADRLKITKEEAARFIDAYFDRYPKVRAHQDRLLQQCRRDGFVSTVLGRRRAINGIRRDSSYKQRNQPEREAVNMEIQGSAADLIKMAMLNIYRRLKKEGRRTRMLLQIHDELVFEAPADEVRDAATMVGEEMTGALSDRLQVPLKVDIGVGPNWAATQEFRWQ